MTRRALFTTLFGIGSILLAADSCAASPLPNGSTALRDRAAGYEMTVLVDGVPVPTYTHGGDTYLLGQLGARYTLRVANHSGRRIEAVVSVDGRDVIDGKPADFRGKRGYLVPAWGSVDIEGWRNLARRGGGLSFLERLRLVRRPDRQRARGRRHRRGRLPGAVRPAAHRLSAAPVGLAGIVAAIRI